MKSLDDLLALGKSAWTCASACVGLLIAANLSYGTVSASNGSIIGRIQLDYSGSGGLEYVDPLEGRTVVLIDENTDQIVGQTTTNINGEYQFSGLANGQYRVSLNETEEYPYYISSVRYGAKDNEGNEFGAVQVEEEVMYEGEYIDNFTVLNYQEYLYDDFYAVVKLPFSFPFYGKRYDRVVIAENGYLSFDFYYHNLNSEIFRSRGGPFQTACVEEVGIGYEADGSSWTERGWLADGCHDYSYECWGATSIIAPLMTDISSYTDYCYEESDNYGSVKYGQIINYDTEEVEAFVVEWDAVGLETAYGTFLTFRAYLYPNGQIRFEYEYMNNCNYGSESSLYLFESEQCDSTIYGSVGLEGPYENNPLIIQDFRLGECESTSSSSSSSSSSTSSSSSSSSTSTSSSSSTSTSSSSSSSSSSGELFYGCGDEQSNYVKTEYAILFTPETMNKVEIIDGETVELDIAVSFYYPATIAGAVQLDTNENGVWDFDDEYIEEEIVIYVDLNNNGMRDEEEPYVLSEQGDWYIGWDPYTNEGIFLPSGTYTFRQDLSFTPQYEEIPERSLVVSALNIRQIMSASSEGIAPLAGAQAPTPPLLQVIYPDENSQGMFMNLLHYRYPIEPFFFPQFEGDFYPEASLDLTAVVNVGSDEDFGGFLGLPNFISGLGNGIQGLTGSGIFVGGEFGQVLGLASINPFNGALQVGAAADFSIEGELPLLLNAPFAYQPGGVEQTFNFAFANNVGALLMELLGGGSDEPITLGSYLVFDDGQGEVELTEYFFEGVFVAGSAVDSEGNIWLSCIDIESFDHYNATNPILFLTQLTISEGVVEMGARTYIDPDLYNVVLELPFEGDGPGFNPATLILTLLGTLMQGLAWDPVEEVLMLALFTPDLEEAYYNECSSPLDLFGGGLIATWYPGDVTSSEWCNYGDGCFPIEYANFDLVSYITDEYMPTGAEVISVTGFTVSLCESECGECGPGFIFLNRFVEQPEPEGNIIFVDAASTAFAPDGSSWEDAFPTLQAGLAEAQARMDELAQNPPQEPVDPLQVWVANGTYTTDSGSFTLVNGVSVYGGFAKTEATPEDRDRSFLDAYRSGETATGTTVLQGVSGTTHVVIVSNTGAETLLDGFVITGGNANVGSQTESFGGGIYGTNASVTVSNSVITGNSARYYGGGVYISGGASLFSGCVFTQNTALFDGGAVYLSTGNHRVDACWFENNTAAYNGGALMTNQAALTLTNSVFGYNKSGRYGGAIQQNSTTAAAKTNAVSLIRNNTFYGNSVVDTRNNPTGYGGALSNDRYVKAIVENNIFWANRARLNPQIYSMAVANITVRYNTIQGNYSPSTFTKIQDPFLNVDTFEIINPLSTAINGGSVDVEPFDLYGNQRLLQTLGAIAYGDQSDR